MATHDVTMNLSHPITVKNVDVEFEVRSDGELLGKLQLSRGGIDWMPFKSHPRGDLGAVRRLDGGNGIGRRTGRRSFSAAEGSVSSPSGGGERRERWTQRRRTVPSHLARSAA